MSARQILKRVITVLSMLLCVEVGFLAFQMNSSANRVTRNLDLGNKYLLAEDYDGAISAFSKAIEIDAMNADAYIGRGDAYKAKGDFEKAWDDYEKAQELSGNTSILRDKIGQTDITIVSEDGEGVDGATIKLNGNNHSYEFITDSTGHIAEVIFPEEYNVEVTKTNYESANIVLSAEKGGIKAEQIQLHGDINSILNDFVRQRSVMYGKTCTFTLTRGGEGNNSFERRWEGLSEGMILGYSIEDFDNDQRSELLLITLVDDYRLQLEMYEVVNEEVVLSDTNNLDTGTVYGAVAFPCGSGSQQTICGLLSAFVNDSNHRIYLQSSEPGLIADGWETFIVSTEYRDNMFSDYKSSHAIGSSIEDSIPDRVQELLDMGVPNIDYDVYDNIFYGLAPLINCFGDGVHEIIHAEQYTTMVEKKNSIRVRIVTETQFATEDGQIGAPTAYSESD